MARRCPHSKFIGLGRLHGYRFRINRIGLPTIGPATAFAVHGTIWELAGRDEPGLDRFEGVSEGDYRKAWLPIRPETGGVRRCLVYVARDLVPGRAAPDLMWKILAAAQDVGLPDSYIGDLSRWLR